MASSSLRGQGSVQRASLMRGDGVREDAVWQQAMEAGEGAVWRQAMGKMEQRVAALEYSTAEEKKGMNNLLQLIEDTMPMEEALADRSYVRQLAAQLHRLEEGVAPAVSSMQAQVDGLQRALEEQARSHAVALAELRAEHQSNTREEHASTALEAALAKQRKDLEQRASTRLVQQVEQLRVASEAASAKCVDLSESVATCGRRMDSVESRVERKVAAATREVRVLSNRLQAELEASQRPHANQHESTLAKVNDTIGQFEVGHLSAVRAEPEPEQEPQLTAPASAILGTVASLEVEVAAHSKRLDALSLELATRGREVAASSRLISQSARSLAMRTGSEPAEAAEATPTLRRSLRALEARVQEIASVEIRIEELEARKVSTDELPWLVKDLISQDEERLLTASHQMSRLQSNLSALVERSAAQSEARMSEMARRVGAVEDQSQQLALTVDAAGEYTSRGQLQRLQREMHGQIEAAVADSTRAMKQLAQVQEKLEELQVSVGGSNEPRKLVVDEAREAATQQQLVNVQRDLEHSIRSLELRCEHCEGAAGDISALACEVEELRIRITVEQQVRQQSAAVSAAVVAAAIPGTLPSPAAPLPVRAMSHKEIRHQLQKYKETQQPGQHF